MLERDYQNCPNYMDDPESCCFARHEKQVSDFGTDERVITYKDGREEIIPTLGIIDLEIIEQNGHPTWITSLGESKEVTDLLVEKGYRKLEKILTPESLQILLDIHPTFVSTPLDASCEFRS